MNKPPKLKVLRHDRNTVSLLTDHLVFSPKYRGNVLVERGWDVVKKYIETQDTHHAKSTATCLVH